MRYVGGKSKIAGRIASAILQNSTSRDTYLEPFVGGGSVLAKIAPHFRRTLAGDASEDLILMWLAVREGWVPPAVTYERYQELRYSRTPSAERGFAGFGGSFGGRWFGGFARGGYNSDGTPRNHQAESSRAVMRIADAIRDSDVQFECRDYRSWQAEPNERFVIYCDPPYAVSLQDYYKPGAFDSVEFWDHAAQWAESGHEVFVSEYTAPEGWVSIWSARKRQSLIVGSSERDVRVEHLWVREGTQVAMRWEQGRTA